MPDPLSSTTTTAAAARNTISEPGTKTPAKQTIISKDKCKKLPDTVHTSLIDQDLINEKASCDNLLPDTLVKHELDHNETLEYIDKIKTLVKTEQDHNEILECTPDSDKINTLVKTDQDHNEILECTPDIDKIKTLVKTDQDHNLKHWSVHQT
ncbi:hypothetical protein WDU94_000095 [Cyamophila willieti]